MTESLTLLVQENFTAIWVFLFSSTIFIFFKLVLIHKLRQKAEKTQSPFDDAVLNIFDKINLVTLLIISVYITTLFLNLSEDHKNTIQFIFQSVVVVQFLFISQSTIKLIFDIYSATMGYQSEEIKAIYDYVSKIIVGAVWIIGIIFILANSGYDVSSLVASLGIGGIAVALAAQKIIEDMFSAFMIFANNPFQVGDTIMLSDKEKGSVEKIDLRNTTIRTEDGIELIIANRDLLNSRIYNFRSRYKRRADFKIFIDLDTPSKKLDKMRYEIVETLKKDVLIDQEESMSVSFRNYNEFAMVYRIVFHMKGNDFNNYIQTLNSINLDIKKIAEKNKIKMASTSPR